MPLYCAGQHSLVATALGILVTNTTLALGSPPLPDVVEKVIDGVVNIRTQENGNATPSAGGQPPDPILGFFSKPQGTHSSSIAQGSGFFVHSRKWIVTNYHVVKDAKEIWVSTNRKKWASLPAKLVAFDARSDIAVLKVNISDNTTTVLTFGKSSELRLGDRVFAIGNPFGYGHTVTTGILSAKGRILGAGPFNDFLQTDTAMNPGNSGGPLFNSNGQVVGINTAIAPEGRGISFSIPAEIAAPIVQTIIKNGQFKRPRLGAFVSDIAEGEAENNRHFGIFVNKVLPNSPAQRAGLLAGDIVLGVEEKPAREIRDLQLALGRLAPHKTLSLTIFRGKKTIALKVTLGEFDERAAQSLGGDEY